MDWTITLAITALVMWILYRRVRRLFGRQRFSTGRLVFRIVLVGTICCMLLVVLSLARGWVPLAGLAVGIAVGILGVALTQFETTEGELHFTPNPYVGLAVLSLVVARLTYRLSRMDRLTSPELPDSGADLTGLGSSPSTVAILFVLLGFYFSYHAAVLVRGWTLRGRPATG